MLRSACAAGIDGEADLLWRNAASGTITELQSAGTVF